MNKPDILGLEVITPDGRGSILALHSNRIVVRLNCIKPGSLMKGFKREDMNYYYLYEEVEIIKGEPCFNDEVIRSRHPKIHSIDLTMRTQLITILQEAYPMHSLKHIDTADIIIKSINPTLKNSLNQKKDA